jgi:hypothetical protein
MTTRLQKLLLGLAASALVALVGEQLWPTKAKIEVIQPTKVNLQQKNSAQPEKKELKRPTFVEDGEDLFALPANSSLKVNAPKVIEKNSLGSARTSTAQIRAIDTKAALVASAAVLATNVAASRPIAPPPALGYTAFGQYTNADKKYLLLTKDGRTVATQVGEVLDGTWKLLTLAKSLSTWQHISTAQIINLPVPPLP